MDNANGSPVAKPGTKPIKPVAPSTKPETLQVIAETIQATRKGDVTFVGIDTALPALLPNTLENSTIAVFIVRGAVTTAADKGVIVSQSNLYCTGGMQATERSTGSD